MDWLFSDETAATLFVLVGTGFFALARHLCRRNWQQETIRRLLAGDSAVMRLDAR
jgi:hypothetical protein